MTGCTCQQLICQEWFCSTKRIAGKAYRGELFLLSAEKGRRVRVKETRAGGGRTDELLRVSISGGTADTAWDSSG
jgi:hypothetical protein